MLHFNSSSFMSAHLTKHNSFTTVVIPGIYGMTKIWKWWQKRQILLRKKARGHQNIDALIEEAEGEMD